MKLINLTGRKLDIYNALRYHGIQRNDCVSPDTAFQSAVRDEAGHVIGIRGFQAI